MRLELGGYVPHGSRRGTAGDTSTEMDRARPDVGEAPKLEEDSDRPRALLGEALTGPDAAAAAAVAAAARDTSGGGCKVESSAELLLLILAGEVTRDLVLIGLGGPEDGDTFGELAFPALVDDGSTVTATAAVVLVAVLLVVDPFKRDCFGLPVDGGRA